MREILQFVGIIVGLVWLPACNEQGRPPDFEEGKDSIELPTLMSQDSGAVKSAVYADVDISPMDMSYFPLKYPLLKMTDPRLQPPVLRVIYSRPHLQGRKLFEEVLKYGEPWRLGANEATELDVYQTVSVDGKSLPEGRYTLYAIPRAGYWTIAFNKDLDTWGLKPDSTQDVMRVKVPVTYYNAYLEYFTMVFEATDTGANLVMGWDDVVARLPILIPESAR
ncbi:hypothetical protein GCM10027051_19730 [Niabella terrae]